MRAIRCPGDQPSASCSRIEAATNESLWRNPTDTVRRYLAFLAAIGYPLSDVEQHNEVTVR